MKPKLIVKSRREAEASNEVDVPHVIISIVNYASGHADVAINGHTLGVLRLWFDDYIGHSQADLKAGKPKRHLFDETDASHIVSFLGRYSAAEVVVVHCEMGVSRSAGVALALARHWGYDTDEYTRSRVYSPNVLVVRLLTEALEGCDAHR